MYTLKKVPCSRRTISIPTLKPFPFCRGCKNVWRGLQLQNWSSAELTKALIAKMNTHRGSSRHLHRHGSPFIICKLSTVQLFQKMYSHWSIVFIPYLTSDAAWGLVFYNRYKYMYILYIVLVLYKYCSASLLNKKSKLLDTCARFLCTSDKESYVPQSP